MEPARSDIFGLAEQRLRWLDQRQTVLAQNIANADSPNYAARDVVPFRSVLASVTEPERTSPLHLTAGGSAGGVAVRRERVPVERTPDGNSVSLEDQLMKVADTDTNQQLVTTVVRKYMGLFRIALGR